MVAAFSSASPGKESDEGMQVLFTHSETSQWTWYLWLSWQGWGIPTGAPHLQTFSMYYLALELDSPVPQFPFSERNWIM